ncbi:MAG: ABC transporter substrate-binding protein [Planctomycetes bacterium]|nr:ABC transporter substrate-binding protein [Planctomycetota bacterium]
MTTLNNFRGKVKKYHIHSSYCSRLILSTILLACTVFDLSAENGVCGDEILIGQSCALSGPAQALGQGMKVGLNACFSEINDAGGIKGKKIKLISMDDGYEPDKAIANTRKLIETDKVFLLIGEVGTPTSKAVVPLSEEAGVPFIGPFTGAGFLRDPAKKILNVRGSYDQEMERLAQYLVDEKKLSKVACFYQNDGYGKVGLSGITKALKSRNLELVATGTYERNTTAVKGGLLKIRKAKPDAVVMVGAYKPCSAFIKVAKKAGLKKTIFCNISFVGTKALHADLGSAGEGCIISQVVNYPWDDSLALHKDYHGALKKYAPDQEVGFVSLEGYMVGKLFTMVASQVEGDLTRKSFMATAEKVGVFDLGGVKLEYSSSDHQGMDEIFLTVIKDGKIVPL